MDPRVATAAMLGTVLPTLGPAYALQSLLRLESYRTLSHSSPSLTAHTPFQKELCFDDELVLQQLRYTGMLETVRIRRSGYSAKYTFQVGDTGMAVVRGRGVAGRLSLDFSTPALLAFIPDYSLSWAGVGGADVLRRGGWTQAQPGRIQRCQAKLGRGICMSRSLHRSALC